MDNATTGRHPLDVAFFNDPTVPCGIMMFNLPLEGHCDGLFRNNNEKEGKKNETISNVVLLFG